MRNAYLSLSGAELRALSTTDAGATAEIARRKALRPDTQKTVAALKSQGLFTLAAERIEAAKVAPKAPKVVVAKVAPAPAVVAEDKPKVVAFTRTQEVVAAPKSAVAHLHNRVCSIEAALLSLAQVQSKQHDVMVGIAKALGVQV